MGPSKMRQLQVLLKVLPLLMLALLSALMAPGAACTPTNVTAHTGPSVCFEKVSDIPAIYLREHPAGGKLVVATQDGLVRLVTLPPVGSGQLAAPIGTYLDLASQVRFKGEQGLLSFAFHPQFLANGRFFVSYICDSQKHPDCAGTCATAAVRSRNTQPPLCPYNTIVAEYSAGPDPGNSSVVDPKEIRKILKFGRPYENHNGGHIWFGIDGYLYYTSGDGGSQKDPLSTAQNGLMPLGKILRLDVDGGVETQWGNYSIPSDNPFSRNSTMLGEIYALGFRNPWRCSLDEHSNLTLCGDVGQDSVEEVDLVQKGHNYGWSFFEGLDVMKPNPPSSPISGSFSAPLLTYCHSQWEGEADEKSGRGLAVIGGHVYRANRNPCLQGKYIFGDEYGVLFIADLFPDNSSTPYQNTSYQNASSSVAFGQGSSGDVEDNSGFPKKDLLFSWGVDSSSELYRLSSSGIFRVTDSSLCNMTCESTSQAVGGNGSKPTNASGIGSPSCQQCNSAVHCFTPLWTSFLALVLLAYFSIDSKRS